MIALKPRILAAAGWVNPSTMPRGPNGGVLCRYCGTESPPRRTFCSGGRAAFTREGAVDRAGHGCVHEHCIRSQPAYARKLVWARDLGRCAICATVCTRNGAEWQADHITPVVEGGGECGLENLRTLCTACHKRETAQLAGRRAAARREVSQ